MSQQDKCLSIKLLLFLNKSFLQGYLTGQTYASAIIHDPYVYRMSCFTGWMPSVDKRNVGALSPMRESGIDQRSKKHLPPLYVSCLYMPYSALD